jgi:hypothetical protein
MSTGEMMNEADDSQPPPLDNTGNSGHTNNLYNAALVVLCGRSILRRVIVSPVASYGHLSEFKCGVIRRVMDYFN